ncbi:hypothetical protein Pmani_007974 [Petrolisthes manimaculis]|uniref:Uncharacterized protein n=1 Tax=Petrolisthes manimaculis TaxID=1843537 RepID=A0AAE1Q7Y8_9EUCA|nr:hypothetical protein Pmani_007974 [Petrolisthes manimaculis]
MEPQPVDVTSIEEAVIKLEVELFSLRDEVEELQGVNNSSQDIVSSLSKRTACIGRESYHVGGDTGRNE